METGKKQKKVCLMSSNTVLDTQTKTISVNQSTPPQSPDLGCFHPTTTLFGIKLLVYAALSLLAYAALSCRQYCQRLYMTEEPMVSTPAEYLEQDIYIIYIHIIYIYILYIFFIYCTYFFLSVNARGGIGIAGLIFTRNYITITYNICIGMYRILIVHSHRVLFI